MSPPSKKSKAALKREPQQTQTQAQPTIITARPALDETESGIILVSPAGDVVLAVEREGPSSETCRYRVDSIRLKEASPYFKRLLDADFVEGTAVAKVHADLKTKYIAIDASLPTDELPQVTIVDVGRISSVKSIKQLMSDFLCALHGRDMSIATPPLANVANLCIVADRFDCITALRSYCKSRKLIAALDAKNNHSKNGANTWAEERVRQRLLIGLFLENAGWVYQASQRLIQRGWVGHETSENDITTQALWWDLPQGIEDELLFRRDCILETIQSLQSHFLALYTTRDRQCKLGYDSSTECDLFQLGQMVKFLKRNGTLAFQGTIFAAADPPEPYDGDVLDLLDGFRKVPEYQIDKNHSHCGLRTRIMPLLDLIQFAVGEVGICLWCWQDCRFEYAWGKVKRPLVWKKDSVGGGMMRGYREKGTQSHLFKHLDTRDLFMANERLWTG